jgi:hypothetical protein
VNSLPLPQLLDTYLVQPVAVASALLMLATPGLFASTSRILQFGQMAETMSRSRDASSAHAEALAGSGPDFPFWLTIFRQPVEVLHAGSPNHFRYTARSPAACESL